MDTEAVVRGLVLQAVQVAVVQVLRLVVVQLRDKDLLVVMLLLIQAVVVVGLVLLVQLRLEAVVMEV